MGHCSPLNPQFANFHLTLGCALAQDSSIARRCSGRAQLRVCDGNQANLPRERRPVSAVHVTSHGILFLFARAEQRILNGNESKRNASDLVSNFGPEAERSYFFLFSKFAPEQVQVMSLSYLLEYFNKSMRK